MSSRSRNNSLWFAATILLAFAAVATAADTPVVEVVSSGPEGFHVRVLSSTPALEPVKTPEGEFLAVGWGSDPIEGAVGTPALPVVRRLFVVPAGATVEIEASRSGQSTVDLDAEGLPWRVMPVQPSVPKLEGALENQEFQFDPTAYTGSFQRAGSATTFEGGIARGQRLFHLEVRPVAYSPAERELTYWATIDINVTFLGASGEGTTLSPLPGLERVVLNPELLPNGGVREPGDNYLIIVDTDLAATIAPFATAKTAQGYNVTTHVVDGDTNTAIKAYIEGLWGTADAPDHILLVGDTDTIPCWTGQGTASPPTDLQYACMDGASDWYPDIAIGRFPARTTAQLNAMIDKTLYYENGPLADPDYLKRAVFMASSDNHTVSEGTHKYVIDTYLDPEAYTSDKHYYYYGATTQDVRDSFNDGRFFGIYSGHGGEYSWADGPPFSQSDVNGLTNENMYSVVWSFACVTGSYDLPESFVETWIRAEDKGAVTIYGSSVNSLWTEDDILEKSLFDVIFDPNDADAREIGRVWNKTMLRYLDHFGPTGTNTRRYFEMYNLMGDPSLNLISTCSEAGSVGLDSPAYACDDTVGISVVDCDLNTNDAVLDTVQVTIDSTSEAGVEVVTLTETNLASGQFAGSIPISTTDSAGVLLVAADDNITVTYVDADDGMGGTNVTVQATAAVDCTAPAISNVHPDSVEARRAVVAFDADEPVSGTVSYGSSCAGLTEQSGGDGFVASPMIELTGLTPSTTYFYSVAALDPAGNAADDDNGGQCYTFDTPVVPVFFTEEFASGDGGVDLGGWSITFTPDGSNDFYRACTSEIVGLPVDPSGGTTLSLSDDANSEVTVPGGQSVSLYGADHTSFFVGSNGYITFGSGSTDYSETLEEHFGTPRVAALYDDLNPSSAGTVSWKQVGGGVVVTWDGVPEFYTSNYNTFQVELRFDGTIVVSYADVTAGDGIVGLSSGNDLDEDFSEDDLNSFADCLTFPLFVDGFEMGSCDMWDDEVVE